MKATGTRQTTPRTEPKRLVEDAFIRLDLADLKRQGIFSRPAGTNTTLTWPGFLGDFSMALQVEGSPEPAAVWLSFPSVDLGRPRKQLQRLPLAKQTVHE